MHDRRASFCRLPVLYLAAIPVRRSGLAVRAGATADEGAAASPEQPEFQVRLDSEPTPSAGAGS